MTDVISYASLLVLVVATLYFFNVLRRKIKLESVGDRPVFITGCDTGFGRMLAEQLDAKGVPVYAGCLLSRSVEELTKTCSNNLRPIRIDVTDTESIEAAAVFVKRDLNGKALWALVNNAGRLGSVLPFELTTREQCRQILEVNLLGMYDVTLAFVPLIKPGGKGRIVNMSSMNGRFSLNAHGYPISKYGVEAFSDGLSYELALYNITVHTLEPAAFKTDLSSMQYMEGRIRRDFGNAKPEIRAFYGGDEYLKEYLQYYEKTHDLATSANTQTVVDAYEHAILARYPKNRYIVGQSAMLLVFISYLPFRLQMLMVKLLRMLSVGDLPTPRGLSN